MRLRDPDTRMVGVLYISQFTSSHCLERACVGKIGGRDTQLFPQTPQPLFFKKIKNKKYALYLTHFNAAFRACPRFHYRSDLSMENTSVTINLEEKWHIHNRKAGQNDRLQEEAKPSKHQLDLSPPVI